MAVPWDRSSILPLALLVAVGVRTAYAAPASSTAQLRATYCCATHCHHRRGVPRSDECCQVASQANDPALLASPFPLHPPLAVHSLPSSPWGVAPLCLASLGTAAEPGSHGPPLFLKVRSLRL